MPGGMSRKPFESYLKDHPSAVRYMRTRDSLTVLTASTHELRKFISRFGRTPLAFSDTTTYKKMSPELDRAAPNGGPHRE